MILKLIKIRDQGMEIQFLMVRFKLCTCGVDFNLRGGFFLIFKK